KTFAIIRREFTERVRTKAFLLSTFGLPIFMVVLMVLPVLMMRGSDRTLRVAVVDATDGGTTGVGTRIVEALERRTIKKGELPKYDIAHVIPGMRTTEAVRDSLIALTKGEGPGRLDGVLVLPAGTLLDGSTEYFGTNVGSMDAMGELQGVISGVVTSSRLEAAGV